MGDCINPQTELKKKQCKWLKEREFANCFDREQTTKVLVESSSKEPTHFCLDRILQDAEYKKINLDADFSYLRDIKNNATIDGNRKTLDALAIQLNEIERKKKISREFTDTVNADLELKSRFTYSALSKLVILALLVILFLTTIMIHNETLYDFTFIIIVIILFYNLYIFMK